MKAKCLIAASIDLVVGNIYEVIGTEDVFGRKAYRVIDDSGEDYLYSAKCFEIVDWQEALKK